MRFKLPIVLWLLVAMVAGGMWYWSNYERSRIAKHAPDDSVHAARDVSNIEIDEEGRAFATVPWKHLPDVGRFKLIDQNGDEFDSADLDGQAYVVSFFFATCPTFCLDLNKEIDRVNSALKDTDIRFLTLTVDPANDTPEKLHKYAEGFGAEPSRWAFLTGQMYQLVDVGEHMFDVPVDPETHSDCIFLVDKWGRYRDRFKWDDPSDMKRFVKVAKQVAAETELPLSGTVKTRNVMAGVEPADLNDVRWIREFYLTERSGDKFYSRDLTGEVWIANFFFSTCPGICQRQNQYLRDLQNRLGVNSPRVVSITTNPTVDTTEQLREFASKLGADDRKWWFLTGDPTLIKRIGSEFFRADSGGDHHSTLLYVVDRWGKVRGSFDWEQAGQEVEMMNLIGQLKNESVPRNAIEKTKTISKTEG